MVFRVEKCKDYTVMSNYHLRDNTLTLKSKGLLSLMLSLPEDWDYSISGLVSICKEGESAIRTALTELEQNGYLKRERIYENGKIVDWNYTVYEKPEKNLDVENQQLGFQQLENQVQLNTNKQNTEKQNTKVSKDTLITESSGFNFGVSKPTKQKRKSNNSEYDDAILLVNNYTNNSALKKELHKLIEMKKEIATKERHHFYCSTIKNYLDELDEVFEADTEQKIEAVKLSVRYNGTTKVMKPNVISNNKSAKSIEQFSSVDLDKDGLSHKKSNREF